MPAIASPLTRWLLFSLCMMPLAGLVYVGLGAGLGPDPGQYVVEYLGHTALVLLLLTLGLSSATRHGLPAGWLRYRRMLGLYSFFYAVLHVLAFIAFILAWRWGEVWLEVRERPYITMGMLALALLLPLALTSNRRSMRWLGRRWKRLHTLVYPALLLVLVHVAWQVRSDFGLWFVYALVAAALLLERAYAFGWMQRFRTALAER